MRHIFGNLKKYWYFVIPIILLLFVQAYCDLSLPDYTSEIIDVGISYSGISHAVPQYMTADSYDRISLFLTEEEKEIWENSYVYDTENDRYELIDSSEQNWEQLDSLFATPIAVVYMMTQQAGASFEGIDFGSMTPEEMAAMQEQLSAYGLDLTSPTLLLDLRKVFEENLSALGDSMLLSMGKSFSKAEYEACGIDLNALQSSYMWRTGGKMVAMSLLLALCSILVSLLASLTGAGVGRDLRGKVFTKVMSFSHAEMNQFSTASLITRSTNDVQQIQFVSVMLLRMVLYAPILAIGGILNIRHYQAGMSWVILLAVAAILCLVLLLMVIAMPKFKIMQDLVDRVNLVAREILTGLPVIRAFGREKKESERFDSANRDLTRIMLFTNRAMAFMSPCMTIIMNGISVLIVWVGANRIDQGVLEVGAMTAFITYSMMIIMGFLMLTLVSIMLPRAGVAANRIQEVLDTESILAESANAVREAPKNAAVRFDHVSFHYPDSDENVLTDIDFEAKPGETTAIIGSTGCGKSTVVKLIPRFYDVSEGAVTIDGVDVRNMALDTLREQIGYVPQKGILFSGTIRSNIGYGASDTSDQNLQAAAGIAQASEFIESKREKYESAVAQGGTNVSGGQKQRLSIARAIARNPKIYIFDDSFSALDFKTDAALRKSLKNRTQDATVLIVAQRVSTILHAEQIIVLEDGRMVGKGTHRELVAHCDTYRQIAQSQLSEKEFAASIAESNGKEGC